MTERLNREQGKHDVAMRFMKIKIMEVDPAVSEARASVAKGEYAVGECNCCE